LTNQFMNMAMATLEDMTTQMKHHQDNGNHELVELLNQEARLLISEMNDGEFITLPMM